MSFPLDRSAAEPLFLQIKRALADRIRSGLLAEGERLPAVREMAGRMGVSPVTVVQAYAALEAAGLVDREQGRGVFVRNRSALVGAPARPAGGHLWQRAVADYVPRSLSWHILPGDRPAEVIPMQIATVGADLLPVQDLVSDLRHVVANNPSIWGVYSPVAGEPSLREAIATHLRSGGIPVSAGEVLVTHGSQQGIDLAARSFIGPGDAVAMESPTYPPAIDAFKARGARIHPIPVDSEGMQVERLAAIPGLKMLYLVPTFQNPTGALLSRRRRRELMALARERSFIILEDEPWREISFGNAPPPPLKSQDPDGHVIYVKSYSKMLSVGIRIGALAASGSFFQRLLAAKAIADHGTALLPQMAVQPFVSSPRLARHLKRLVPLLAERREAVLTALERHAPRGVRWNRPAGGLSVWVTLPEGLDAEQLLPGATDRGLAFAPGIGFYPGDPDLNRLRLTFGSASPEELQRGVAILCDLIRQAL